MCAVLIILSPMLLFSWVAILYRNSTSSSYGYGNDRGGYHSGFRNGPLFAGGRHFELKTEYRTVRSNKYLSGRRKIPTYYVVSTPSSTYSIFAFSREGGWHSFLKELGLCHESQTGDPSLDQKLFTECDDDEFLHTLFRMEGVKPALEDIVNLPVKQVWHDGNHIKARIPVDAHHKTIEETAAALATIAAALDKLPKRDLNFIQKFFLYPHFQVRAFSTVLLLLGIGLTATASYTNILDTDSYFSTCLTVSTITLAVLIPLILLALAGSSYIAKEILIVGTLTLLTAAGFGFGGVSSVNAQLDKSPRLYQEAVVESKSGCKERKKRRSRKPYYTNCYLKTAEFAPGLSTSFLVKPDEFFAAQPFRTRVKFYQHEGFLGIKWYEDLTISF